MAAETVDTRVVEAKFDSKQFEQGVDRTVKKLDELKKSLNLKDGEKSVADIGNKISETSEKASESLEKLEKRFTSFFGMLKQKLISGIADEIVGSIFKVKNAINGLVSSLSTGQIGYGMQRYTDILTSVRTLTASGVNEGAAYETIERLGEYADQTSYSLDQLVSTMSKFKTAGADLGTAQRMVEGLSNAAASMGVNAQDAARAYLNLQQAYSKGKMTQADWISFESLPMVGEKFNQAIIDAAVKVGTLKQNAKGTYEVVSKAVKAAGGTGGRVSGAAAKGITAENMGSKLASGWFNKQVMEEVFGSTYYFAEVGIDEVNAIKEEERKIRADVKKDIANAKIAEADYDKEVTSRLEKYFKERNKVVIDEKKAEIEARKESAKADLDSRKIVKEEYDKLIKDLDKEMKDFEANNHLSAFAYQAFTAGQEARSFTDVLNTLKDTISRGWATSFELIFGKLDEAKDFFTSLTESQLAEGIYAIGEFRNAVLENWRNSGGRESLLGLLEYMDNIAGSIWKKLGLINDEEKWFNDNFDQQKYNQILKQEGKEQAEAYKEQVRAQASAANPFEQTAKELGQRLSILTRNIQDFFEKVHKWFTEADSTGTSRLQRISNILEGFGTIGRGALYAVGQGLEFIGKVYNTFKTSFDALWKAIDNISQKVFAVFNPDIKTDGFNIFTALADTFENILTVLKPLNGPLTTFIGILEDVVGFFVDMGISSILMNIQFFTDGFALLLEVLGLGSSQQARGAGVLNGIVRDIKDLGESCKSAMTAVGDFFKSLFDDLRVLVGLKEDQNGEKHGIFANIENWFNTNEFVQKVKAKINKAFVDIGDFVKDLPNRITNIGINIGDFFKGIFYEKTLVTEWGPTGQTSRYEWIKKPLTEWIENAVNTVWNFITVEIPNFVNSIPSVIDSFFNSLFYTNQVAQIKYINGKPVNYYTRTPLKVWLDQAVKDVWNFITVDIPKFVSKIPSVIGKFFDYLFGDKIVYKYQNGKLQSTRQKGILKDWLDNVISDVKKFIKDVPKNIKNIGIGLGDLLKSIFFEKKVVSSYGANGQTSSYQWVQRPLTKWIDENIITGLKEFVKNLPTYIGQAIGTVSNFAGQVVSAIFGKEDGSPVTADDVTEGIRKPFLGANVTGIINSIKGVAKRILSGIASAFTGETDWESNKNWLAEGAGKLLENIKTKAEEVWDSVQDFFATLPEKIEGFFKRSADETEKGGTIWIAGQSVIDGIGKWLSTVPNLLLNAWKSAEALSGGLWNTIIGWITGKSDDKQLNAFNQNIYDQMRNSKSFDTAEMFKESALKQQWRENNPIAANIEDFFKNFIKFLGDKIVAIPGQIKGIASNAWDVLSAVKDVIFGTVNEEKYKNKDDSNPLYTATVDVFKAVVKFVTDNAGALKDEIVKGWNKAVTFANIISEVFFGGGKQAFNQKEYDSILNSKGLNAATRNMEAKIYKNSTTDYGSETRNNIANFFVNVRNWVREQITNLPKAIVAGWNAFKNIGATVGPTILDALQKVFSWVSEKFTSVTSMLDSAHKEGKSVVDILKEKLTYKDENGNEIENPIWAKVKSIGETLYKMITETIPGFITSAIDEIKMDLPSLISKIFSFGKSNNNSKEDTKKVEKDVKEQAKEIMEESLTTFTKESKTFKTEPINAEVPVNVVYKQDNPEESAENLLDTLGKYIPFLPSSAKAEDEIIDIPKFFTNPLKNLIADPIFNYANNTITKFVDSTKNYVNRLDAIADLRKQLEKAEADKRWNYGKNEKEYLDAANEAYRLKELIKELESTNKEMVDLSDYGKKDTVDGATNVIESMGGFLGAIGDFATGKGADLAKLAIIAYILQTVADMLSLSDELEAPGYTAKWTGIKLAIVGIIGIIGYLAYLNETGDETKLKRVERTFTKLTELFDKISGVLIAYKALDTVGTTMETLGTATSVASGAGAAKVTGGILAGAAVVGWGGDIITEGLSSWSLNLTEVFEKIGVGMDDLVKAIENLASLSDKVDAAKTSIGRVTEIFDEMKKIFIVSVGPSEESGEEQFKNIEKEVLSIINMFVRFSGSISIFKQAISTYNANTTGVIDALERIVGMRAKMKLFGEFANSKEFADFKSALSSIGATMQLFSFADVDDVNVLNKRLETWKIENAVGLLEQFFGHKQLSTLIGTLSKEEIGDGDELMRNAESLVTFAGALVLIAKACGELNSDPNNGTGSQIQKLVDIVSSIDMEKSGKSIDEVSSNFGTLGNSIASFAINTSGLDATNIKNAQTAIQMVLDLAIGLNAIPNNSFIAKLFTGDKDITSFGIGMENLGQNLQKFFGYIQNVDTGGISVDFNRNNLDLALEAVMGIAESVYIISRAPYLNTFDKSLEGGLLTYLGDLGELGNRIMQFVVNVCGYQVPAGVDVNFEFVKNAISSINDISEAVMRLPQTSFGYHNFNLAARVENLGKILLGDKNANGDPTSYGVVGYLNDFFTRILALTKSDSAIGMNLSDISTIISAYVAAIEQVATMIQEINANRDKLSISNPDWESQWKNPMEYLVPAFTSFNDNFSVFETFFDKINAANYFNLTKALNFFNSLQSLANALYIFSQTDESTGQYNVTSGLTKLMEFNWESLRSVIDDMNGTFGSDQDFTEPHITPVLELDDFRKSAEELHNLLGITPGPDGQWISPNYSINISGIDIPEVSEISRKLDKLNSISDGIDVLKTNTDLFRSDLRNMKFVINGEELTMTLLPTFDTALNVLEIVAARANGK